MEEEIRMMKRRDRREEWLARMEREKLDLVYIILILQRQNYITFKECKSRPIFQLRDRYKAATGKSPTKPREERYIVSHYL